MDSARLDVTDQQLAVTACSDLTFALMKSALKRIFAAASSKKINQEMLHFITEQKPWSQRKCLYLESTEQIWPQSTFQWVKNCPHKGEQVKLTDTDKAEGYNLTLYTKESPTEAEYY